MATPASLPAPSLPELQALHALAASHRHVRCIVKLGEFSDSIHSFECVSALSWNLDFVNVYVLRHASLFCGI